MGGEINAHFTLLPFLTVRLAIVPNKNHLDTITGAAVPIDSSLNMIHNRVNAIHPAAFFMDYNIAFYDVIATWFLDAMNTC